MYLTTSFFFLLLIYLLLISISMEASPAKLRSNRAAESTELTLNESPYWEYILREFVFKTISSLPQSNNVLYKKLLEAPFYGGPLLTLSNEDNTLLSRGDVYHLPNGQWILCQEGCENCKLCLNQKDSLVKWELKKVKPNTSSDLYKYDLQLTVVPQRGSTALSNFGIENIYIPYGIKSSTELSKSDSPVTEHSHIDRTRFSRSWRQIQRDQIRQLDKDSTNINQTEELLSLDNSTIDSQLIPRNSHDTSPAHRLILGADQLGNKHVIHILSLNSSSPEKLNFYNDVDYQLMNNAEKLSKMYSDVRKLSPYQRYLEKILDSIHNHRPIVETFLSHDQLNQNKRDK
ncbi:uncharacterized protein LOC141532989 [Cotesia typhae]|uniref:uncharacterized protein LOC141532989 n=1 Tax=Cotesia typhae TaxID=2053667 RepID=UPI003D6965FF